MWADLLTGVARRVPARGNTCVIPILQFASDSGSIDDIFIARRRYQYDHACLPVIGEIGLGTHSNVLMYFPRNAVWYPAAVSHVPTVLLFALAQLRNVNYPVPSFYRQNSKKSAENKGNLTDKCCKGQTFVGSALIQ